MPSATFDKDRAYAGLDAIHCVVKFKVDDVTVYSWSGLALADPAAYEDGYKEERLLLVEDIVLALSDRQGAMQATKFDFTISDLPGSDSIAQFRDLLDTRKTFRNVDVECKFITDAQRRLGYDMKKGFVGRVERYEGNEAFTLKFECIGWMIPRFNYNLTDDTVFRHFPNVIKANRTLPPPILLGRESDEPSATPAPVLADETDRNVVGNPDGSGSAGIGLNPGGNPATAVTLVENLGTGSFQAGDVLRGFVVAIYGSTPADPAPIREQDIELTVTTNGSAVTLAWSAPVSGTPSFYRACLARVNAGQTYWNQFIQTTSLSAQFTKGPAYNATTFDPTDYTTSAIPCVNFTSYFDRWSAVMSDGLTILTGSIPTGFAWDVDEMPFAGIMRRECVEPVPSALGYYVYRSVNLPTANPDRRKFVPADQLNADGNVFLDTTNDGWEDITSLPIPKGKIAPVVLGPIVDKTGTTWAVAFAVCMHAIDLSTPMTVYRITVADGTITPVDPGEYGITVAAPGQAGYSTYFDYPYVDALGKFWTIVAYRSSDAPDYLDGTKQLRVNCLGAEDVGDGSGTVITDGYDQLAFLMDNLTLLEDTTALGGLWKTYVPAYADTTPKRDLTSWTLAKTNAAALIPEGNDASRYITTKTSWSTLFADMFPSLRILAGVNGDGAFQIVVPGNPDQPHGDTVTQTNEILRQTFGFKDTDEGYATDRPYTYDKLYVQPGSESEGVRPAPLFDNAARLRNRETKIADDLNLTWRYRADQALRVTTLALNDSKDLPRTIGLGSGFHWVQYKLGDLIPVTHEEGPKGLGYVDHLVQVLGLRISDQTMQVIVTAQDLRGSCVMTPTFGFRYTQDPEFVHPAAAVGVMVTPNAVNWAWSNWFELHAGIPEAWDLSRIQYNAGGDAFFVEIQIGTGAAAGSPTPIATFAAQIGNTSFTGYGDIPFPTPYGPITAGTPLAVRIRKFGTNVANWNISVGYFKDPIQGNPYNSLVKPEILAGAGGDGVLVTPNGTAGANSAWVEAIASAGGALTLAHVISSPGTEAHPNDFGEVDIGVGAVTPAVVATFALNPAGDFWRMGTGIVPVWPLSKRIASSDRVWMRLRKSGTDVNPWFFKLVGYTGFDQAFIQTTKAHTVVPSAADPVILTSAAGVFAAGAPVQLVAALASNTAIVGVSYEQFQRYEGEIEVMQGALGEEEVVALFHVGTSEESNHAILHAPRLVLAGQRLSAQYRCANSAVRDIYVKFHLIALPDFTDLMTEKVQSAWPYHLPMVSINYDTFLPWDYSDWTEITADSGPLTTGITGILLNGTDSATEIQIGYKLVGDTDVTVLTTHGVTGEGNASSHTPYHNLSQMTRCPAHAQVLARVRGAHNEDWNIALTYVPLSGVETCVFTPDIAPADDIALVEETMVTEFAGGDRNNSHGYQADGVVDINNWLPVRFDWDQFPTGYTLQFRVYCQTESGGSQKPRVTLDDDTLVLEGVTDTNTVFTAQVIGPIVRPGGGGVKTYKIRSTLSGCSAKNAWAIAFAERIAG